MSEVLEAISNRIWKQDNRATSDPMFIVQERRRIYGIDTDYTDSFVWVHCDGDEASDEEHAELEQAFKNDGDDSEGWDRTGFLDQWVFVTACFTEDGCKQYIETNGHNLNDPRIYVASAYRNEEFIAVREWLKEIKESQ